MTPTRRTFLGQSLGALGWAACRPAPPLDCGEDAFSGGIFEAVVPFDGEATTPFGVPTGQGWDGRLLNDLSRIEEDDAITPNDRFYVRTQTPDRLTTAAEDWQIAIDGRVASPSTVSIADLAALRIDHGEILLECSGNSDSSRFGLLSAARWSGAPLLDVLDRHAAVDPSATRVQVDGFDDHSVPSNNDHSTPGAGWIFSLDELAEYGALLATTMNGQPLPSDHGAPVRLLVPRWYGCACIKWVDRITLVDDAAPATSQMQEFAVRTHQDGIPDLARDYRPAAMEQAAMPVRIERWRIDGQIAYRILGILWGGDDPVDALTITLANEEAPVLVCRPGASRNTWSLWEHRFVPEAIGEVPVRMRIDAAVPQIRLDRGWYNRRFTVAAPL